MISEGGPQFTPPMHPDGYTDDLVGAAFRALAAAAALHRAERVVAKAARRLELRPMRAEAARKGWETRRAREAAERVAEAAEAAWDDELAARRGTGPWCDEMNHNGIGSEVFCIGKPGHGDDHEDIDGFAWENED